MKPTALINEIFVSFQGEGILVGAPQAFLRFSGCNLRCCYCDTSTSRVARAYTVKETARRLYSLGAQFPRVRSLSLTGGEPLLWADFIRTLAQRLRGRFSLYLETNGLLAEEFLLVADVVDMVSLDVKLASSTQCRFPKEQFTAFVRAVHKKKRPFFLKVVVTDSTKVGELIDVLRDNKPYIRDMTIVLQPVTARRGVRIPSQALLQRFYKKARAYCNDVRIIPQVHAAYGWR